MKNVKILFFNVFIFISFNLFSQDFSKIESLKEKIKTTEGLEKVNLLNELVEEILKPEPNADNCAKAKSYAVEAAKLAEILDDKSSMIISFEQCQTIFKVLDYQIQKIYYKNKLSKIDRSAEVKQQQSKIEQQKLEIAQREEEAKIQAQELAAKRKAIENQRAEAEKIKIEIDQLSENNIENKDLIEKKKAELLQKQSALEETTVKYENLSKEAQNLLLENKLKDAELKGHQLEKYLLLSIALGGLVLALVLFVMFRNKHKTAKTLSEKNAIIEAEQKRSEELLLNILPKETANELKEFGKASAKNFDNVTVMLTDFKDFTKVSEKLTPKELVDEIDLCFTAFDDIIEKYGLEKIKTIGDAYLCAQGIPNGVHDPMKVLDAAKEILDFMEHLKEIRKVEGKDSFSIRIGINSGPLVAGVVGKKKFAYDIWGDTVNTAARMEQNSEPGKINISESTFNLIKNKYKCTSRGKLPAKNKGEIEMFFVDY